MSFSFKSNSEPVYEVKPLLNEVFNEGTSGQIVVDVSLHIVLWNNWMENYTSVKREVAIGQQLTDLYPQLEGQHIHRAIQAALQTGKARLLSPAFNKVTLPLFKPHEKDLLVEQIIHIKPLSTPGKECFCLLQVTDVTASIQREKMLREVASEAASLRQTAEHISELKSGFVTMVGHELRTPLTSIIASLGLLDGGVVGELPEKARSLIAVAKSNSERLSTLINDILDIEKIETGKREFCFTAIPIEDVLRRSIEISQPLAEKYGVKLVLEPAAENVCILADFDSLMQVMDNLLSNAIKYEQVGQPVIITSHVDGNLLSVSVTDSGPGIPESFRPNLFRPFGQVDCSDQRKNGGIGLGLAICKAIIEEHNGMIDVESEEGKGACFFFQIPRYHCGV